MDNLKEGRNLSNDPLSNDGLGDDGRNEADLRGTAVELLGQGREALRDLQDGGDEC